MDTKYNLNPCKSCKQNYNIKDLNSINQCCYDTLNAFEGSKSIERNNFPMVENCKQCLKESIHSIGRDSCNMRLGSYPSWIQAPHYFPSLLDQERNVEKARHMCMKACESNRYRGECELNCKLDSDAVKAIENFIYNDKYKDSTEQQNNTMNIAYIVLAVLGTLAFLGYLYSM